jgi:hypothetical protein
MCAIVLAACLVFHAWAKENMPDAPEDEWSQAAAEMDACSGEPAPCLPCEWACHAMPIPVPDDVREAR